VIAEIGHFALILTVFVTLVQATLPLWGAKQANAALMALARPAAQVQFLLVLGSFLALTYAFVTSDFSVSVVAQNSHSAKPMLYKISGVWGNHEGSMVLWVLILSVFGAGVATFGRNLPDSLRARVLAVQAMIALGFLIFTVATSNPFERVVPPPIDGRGLNPLLQDPGLAFHPPFLYLGYVGFSMAFSFAVAALIEGRVDAAWARWVRPWTLAAWCCLTLGIALGSWWAYYELGWGGWWFWDPVENASFMPWLAGTALLHSAIVVEKREAMKSWTILLAIITFSLSLIGTFLVRSGVLTSVHAFATDPTRGVFILVLLVITIGGSLALYALRAPALKTEGVFAPISREGGLVLNNFLLSIATATVFIGTLYPLFTDAIGGAKISVGAPYFNATFGPIMVPLLLALPIGALMAWKRGDLVGVIQRLWFAGVAALVVLLFVWYVKFGGPVLAVFGMAIAAWLIVGAMVELAERLKLFRTSLADSLRRASNLPRAAYGMTIAHTGLGIVVAGVVGASAWQVETIQVMRPAETVEIAGYEVTLEDVKLTQGPNYTSQLGTFLVTRGGKEVARLHPEKRTYPVQQMPTTESGIHTTWLADLYAALGDPQGDGGWSVRIYHNPLVPWLWAGSVIMVIGGAVSLSDRRYRVGAPARRRRDKALPAGTATAGT
jgi:cytochrome c-type biogenesis protein CcmF